MFQQRIVAHPSRGWFVTLCCPTGCPTLFVTQPPLQGIIYTGQEDCIIHLFMKVIPLY